MELRLNFKEAPKLINERNQKSLFLFLQLPWLTSVIASISTTSQGLVYIIVPKNVNESFLGFIFSTIHNRGVYIIAAAVCNFAVDLLFFYMLMLFKYKFEINKLRAITLLLTGHLLALSLYFFSSINENTDAIVMSVMRLFFLASTFYILLRYLPRKYLEILLPYSLIFTAFETQTLRKTKNKSTYNRAVKNSVRRTGMYIKAMLLTYVGYKSEMDLIGLLRKQGAIDRANSGEIKRAVQDFYGYLNSSFKIQIPATEIVFKEESSSEKLLRKFISSLDTIFSPAIFFVARYSKIQDLEEKTYLPIAQNNPPIPSPYDNKNFRRLIKYHLDRAKQIDVISAKQKLNAFIFSSFLSLVFPTILYIIRLGEDGSSSILNYRSVLLYIQYLATFVAALLATNLMRTRYRDAGVDVTAPNKLVGYFANSLQFLIFFIVVLSGDKITYTAIIPILSQNLEFLLVGISIVQLILLFMLFKPPVELKKSSFASSLLVRELLLLYSQILGTRSMSNQRWIGRYIYFSKKYLNLIAKDLIYSRFDAQTQKANVREYFKSISNYLDNLGTQIKIGGEKNRAEGIDQIKALILFTAIEEFGEIPNAIPELQRHLEIKSIQPKSPSLVRQFFQVLDTSASARTILVILIFIIINLFIPSLWVYLQNISSLFQLLAP